MMFTFADAPQSVKGMIQDSGRLYITYARHTLGTSLVFAVFYVTFIFFNSVLAPLMQELIHYSLPILKGLLATNMLIYQLLIYFATTFTLTVLIHRLYRYAIELPEPVMQNMRCAWSCILRMLVVLLVLISTVAVGLQLFVMPGLIAASLLVFALLYVVCEDARLDVALKASVLLIWNHGGMSFVSNVMRAITMLFYPVLIKYGFFIVLTWLSQWLMPLFQWLGQGINQMIGSIANVDYALVLNHMVVQLIVTTLLLPLQVAALLVAFNDLKQRYVGSTNHASQT